MAAIRKGALELMAQGREPKKYHWASIMIYLERYEVIELEFDI